MFAADSPYPDGDEMAHGVAVWTRSGGLRMVKLADINTGGTAPQISRDGRFVVFSGAPPSTPDEWGVYVSELAADKFTRVAADASGASVSGDGRFVSYVAESGEAERLDRVSGERVPAVLPYPRAGGRLL